MKLDRKARVTRHHPRITRIEPLSPLSVGNGSFAFTADITGLQTFPDRYEVPLGTQSHWGWHYSGGRNRYRLEDLVLKPLDTFGRPVGYPIDAEGQEDVYHWLRQNPHRLQLGQISFVLLKADGSEASASDLAEIDQELNLWEGVLYSRFRVEGVPVSVITACDAEQDRIGVRVESPLIRAGRLKVRLRFPAPDMTDRRWEESIDLDWGHDHRHQSRFIRRDKREVQIERTMDEDGYDVCWSWSAGELEQNGPHTFTLHPGDAFEEFEFCIAFAEKKAETASFSAIYSASREHWERFWLSGGALDLSDSRDERAGELERRVVLSEFLTALHSAGPYPPQETGLLYNSWFGKFHLEMHWWHGAHFPLWGRSELLARSMDWYVKILPQAKELARSQGYEGARWPKQVGPDGRQSPSPISPLLIWQQPHPIYLAELIYLSDPKREWLERWKEIVFASADFMASYAHWNEAKKAYDLGPPLIPAQENHKPMDAVNPPYELEYWKLGLEMAIQWAERLGEPASPKWAQVAHQLASPPHKDGVYLAHEHCPDTFQSYNEDHPSMVGALGILPGTMIDREIMRATLKKVKEEWKWDTAWGWDFPMCAMTAARLGEGKMAVDFLLMDAAKNTYLLNGHNHQRYGLTAYLPGNGGLLTAVAMMAAGWSGAPNKPAPGFPDDGTWTVRWEGLRGLI